MGVVPIGVSSGAKLIGSHDDVPVFGEGRDHMRDLCEYAGEVARLFQGFQQGGDIFGDGVKAQGSTAMWKASGHPHRSGWLADGNSDMAVFESDSLRSQSVDVWCDARNWTAVDSDRITVHVINCDHDHVDRLRTAPLGVGFGRCGNGKPQQRG